MRYSVLIIGAGHAGGRAAQALRQLSHVGSIGLVGDEAHPPYERPPLSKDFLLGRAELANFQLLAPDDWRAQDINLQTGKRALSLDAARRIVSFDDGSCAGYDSLILATGARARKLQLAASAPGAGRFHYLRDLDDARRLRVALQPGKRLAIIGAGFVGLELSAIALQLGMQVTLVEAEPHALRRALPAAFSHWLVGQHRARGATVLLGRKVVADTGISLILDDGASVPADCIAIGIGAVPNDELAIRAGLEARDGVLVDDACRTSDKHVYAIGDVARFTHPGSGVAMRLESWRNAEDQALRVARAICGADCGPQPVPWFWTDQHGRTIQLAGWPADELELIERGSPDTGPYLAYFLCGDVLRGVIGVDCPREVRKAQMLIQQGRPLDPTALAAPRVRAAEAIA